MSATWSVRIVKQFTYRGVTRNFSNRYHIGTNGPPDSTHWTTFCDAIVAAEKTCYEPFGNPGAKIIQAVGYAAGSEVPVFTKTYAVDGTLTHAASSPVPGDCAAVVRYSTPDRSTKNHPVYCFNYYHAIQASTSVAGGDTLAASNLGALGTYAALWIAGISDGTTTYHRSRPTGDLCTGYVVKPLISHRDLPH